MSAVRGRKTFLLGVNTQCRIGNARYDQAMSEHETLLALYRCMVRIRAFENAAEAASQGGVSAYGEAADGTARGYPVDDFERRAQDISVEHPDVVTHYRDHGHALARGLEAKPLMAELFGKATGFNGGKGGSMHIADFSVGMLGANGVVAAGLPIAVGAAHAQKLLGSTGPDAHITVCFFGDGAINRGPFLEALNWAQVYQLPVLFVCEDNRWSATTESGATTAGEGASARAGSLGIAATQVDGNDVLAVHAAAGELVAQVRAGGGPRLLHAMTYRVKGHVSVDPAGYRDPAQLAAALLTDPILRCQARVQEHFEALGLVNTTQAAIEKEAEQEVQAALDAAEAAPWPDAAQAFVDVQTTGEGMWF